MTEVVAGERCPDCPLFMEVIQGTVQRCRVCRHFRDTSVPESMKPYVEPPKTFKVKSRRVKDVHPITSRPEETGIQPVKKD